MSWICSNGHRSTEQDSGFCPICGHALRPSDRAGPTGAATVEDAAGRTCRVCGSQLEPDASFCTVCGGRQGDGTAPASGAGPPPGASPGTGPVEGGWEIEIGVSREQWAAMSSSRAVPDCPDHLPARRVPLNDPEIVIGRVRRGTDPTGDLPQVNLAALPGHPEDSGISRRHARLRRDGDDGWFLSDSGSKNGVYLNGRFSARLDGSDHRVGHGDRIHVGAWTVLTILLGGPASDRG